MYIAHIHTYVYAYMIMSCDLGRAQHSAHTVDVNTCKHTRLLTLTDVVTSGYGRVRSLVFIISLLLL